jgi:hypothetical protein
MMSEWMKVMLEEIARKKEDAEQAKIEQRRRREEEAAALPQESDRIPKRR